MPTIQFSVAIRRVFLTALFLLVSAGSVFAHDPGLSSAKLNFINNILTCVLTFAPADIDAVTGGEKLSDAQLKNLAGSSVLILLDGHECPPFSVNTKTLGNNDVEFTLTYSADHPARLQFQSRLFDRLPFGHRQYFSLTSGGAVLAEKLLSHASHEVDVTLGTVATVATAPSHPFSEFLGMGIKHILTGYDHLLFLFALLIACKRFSSVIKVITAFTVAHSISLALATLGWVQIPSRIVEPLIAASIVYVSIENLFGRNNASHRVMITFAFGLIHGFGFAGALTEMGVGANGSAIAVPLLAFNSGVEIGQLAVASLVLPILWKLKDRPQFTLRWAPACSVLVALLGAFWFIQRVAGV